MPNNPAAEKRMRQEQKRRLHNRSIKSLVKTQITKARQAINGEDANSEAAVRAAVSELDRAAKKGVIHRNNAARRKSRLMKQLNNINQSVLAPQAPPLHRAVTYKGCRELRPYGYLYRLSMARTGGCEGWPTNKPSPSLPDVHYLRPLKTSSYVKIYQRFYRAILYACK
jgi:small subunit ribosomal protein S20